MSQKRISSGVVHEVPADLKKVLTSGWKTTPLLLARVRPPLIPGCSAWTLRPLTGVGHQQAEKVSGRPKTSSTCLVSCWLSVVE
jgi:hypothetical protein